MPNWVTTKVFNVQGDKKDINRMVETLRSYERHFENGKEVVSENAFDFNNIIPMPKDLMIDDRGSGDKAMREICRAIVEYKPFDFINLRSNSFSFNQEDLGLTDEDINLGLAYIKNFAKYGHKTWYKWSTENWGTKWNSCDTEMTLDINGNPEYEFTTAWSFPLPIFDKLAVMFPKVSLEAVWADEDSGCNTGRIKMKNGKIEISMPENGSDEAFDNYFFTHPGAEDGFYKDEDGWHCRLYEIDAEETVIDSPRP